MMIGRCAASSRVLLAHSRSPCLPIASWREEDQRSYGILGVCNMGASLYEPINVYKPVAPDIGIVDGPFEYLTVGGIRLPLPFTTRMTVVRLSNGGLFLHSHPVGGLNGTRYADVFKVR